MSLPLDHYVVEVPLTWQGAVGLAAFALALSLVRTVKKILNGFLFTFRQLPAPTLLQKGSLLWREMK